ncbi:MAG TPA: ABC transporter permease [Phycisphaerales bacterium]|nr:ABC transporter permease [Phycisphaerales bacterium]
MKGAGAIASRELGSYFRQPAGWIIIALYLFLTAMVFSFWVLNPGQPATLRSFFAVSGWLLLPVVPAVSMRLISDELKSGTLEGLLTSPVTGPAIVLGKFFGAALFLLGMLLPTLVFVALLFRVSEPAPDVGPLVSGYLCLTLLALLYLSIGTLATSLTSNATLAFMITLFAILGLMFMEGAYDKAPAWLRPVVGAMLIRPRIEDFAKGVIDTGHVVFFLSTTGWFLLLSVASVELRRWR